MTLKQFVTKAGAATTLLVAVTLVAMLLVVTAKQAAADVVVIERCSSTAEEICKTVTYDDGDGIIDVGEPISYTVLITVYNGTGSAWNSAVVTDTFGSDLDLSANLSTLPAGVNLTRTTTNPKGKGTGTEKWKLNWNIGTLGAGGTATLTLTAETDINPGGNQEYTSCGLHVVNGGANLRFGRSARQQQSFNTGAIYVSVVCPEEL